MRPRITQQLVASVDKTGKVFLAKGIILLSKKEAKQERLLKLFKTK